MALNFPFKINFNLAFFLLTFSSSFVICNNLKPEDQEKCNNSTTNLGYNCIMLPTGGQNFRANVTASGTLKIFCYPGQPQSWFKLWINPQLMVEGSEKMSLPDDMEIYYGSNMSDVKSQEETIYYRWKWNAWFLLRGEHSFSPFNFSCVGLKSEKNFTVLFRIKNPEFWYVGYVLAGIIIFFYAPSWSRNVILHYGTGVTIGVMASLLILMFILSRLLPQRLKVFSFIVTLASASISMWFLTYIKKSLQEIVQNHWQIALGYVVVAGLLSFAIVYRYGPITDSRTLDMVRWSLQALGLTLIFHGTQIHETSIAIIIAVLTIYLCPKSIPSWMILLSYKFYRPRKRFLTEEEYQKEGDEETQKALNELREFCHSPKCDPWQVVSRLSSPTRFAKFVDGDPHINENEIEEHNTFVQTTSFSDVSDSEVSQIEDLDLNDHSQASDSFSDIENI